jgi:hypothetical protein
VPAPAPNHAKLYMLKNDIIGIRKFFIFENSFFFFWKFYKLEKSNSNVIILPKQVDTLSCATSTTGVWGHGPFGTDYKIGDWIGHGSFARFKSFFKGLTTWILGNWFTSKTVDSGALGSAHGGDARRPDSPSETERPSIHTYCTTFADFVL